MHSIRRITVTAAFLVAIPFAAQQQLLPPLTERVEVNVVNVDVTVLDHGGHPVRGLTAADFEVFEDKKPQRITNFAEVVDQLPVAKRSVDDAGQSTAYTPDAQRRHVLVITDATRLWGVRLMESLKRFVTDNFTERDEWSVVTYGAKSQTVQPFTSDRDAVMAALTRASHGVAPETASMATAGAGAQRRLDAPGFSPAGPDVDRTAGVGTDTAVAVMQSSVLPVAVLHAIRAMAAMEGQKSILLVTTYVPGYERPGIGMPVLLPNGTHSLTQEDTTLARLHAAMVRAANAANVRIFVLDPMGVGGNFDNAMRRTSGSYWLSRETGGSYLRSNRTGDSIAEFQAATTNYYELAYHATAADNRYHRIDVKLKRPGRYAILHRDGYRRVTAEVAFEETLATPLGIAEMKSTLPVRLEFGGATTPDPPDHTMVAVRVSVPMDRLTLLNRRNAKTGRIHLYVTAFDKDNNPVLVKHFVATISYADSSHYDAFVMNESISLRKDAVRIYAAVRDELSDEIGIASKEF